MTKKDDLGWIKTTDERPSQGKLVLVVHQTNYQNAPPHQSVGVAFYEHGQWYAHGGAVYSPTHWQPFPEPPAVV